MKTLLKTVGGFLLGGVIAWLLLSLIFGFIYLMGGLKV